ncbi:hypothetical protein Vafri_7279, partial [Volvox africanus]
DSREKEGGCPQGTCGAVPSISALLPAFFDNPTVLNGSPYPRLSTPRAWLRNLRVSSGLCAPYNTATSMSLGMSNSHRLYTICACSSRLGAPGSRSQVVTLQNITADRPSRQTRGS